MNAERDETYQNRWHALWQALGVANPDAGLLRQLIRCYSEPQRSYHSVQHLDECLLHLDMLRGESEHAHEVELALWFHDAIYDTQRQDNEQRSADWAREAALAARVAGAVSDRVHALVLTTRHQALPVTPDEKILIDVDLAILGATPERFAQYEQQIEQEYAWVDATERRAGRQRILLSFLEREAIYSSALFKVQREQQARANLRASIARLEATGDEHAD